MVHNSGWAGTRCRADWRCPALAMASINLRQAGQGGQSLRHGRRNRRSPNRRTEERPFPDPSRCRKSGTGEIEELQACAAGSGDLFRCRLSSPSHLLTATTSAPGLHDEAGNVRILIGNILRIIEHEDDDVRVLDRLQRLID